MISPTDKNMLDLKAPALLRDTPNILLGHGGGGKLTQRLIDEVFVTAFANPLLAPMHDGALLNFEPGVLAFSTDSYVVNPLVFPGGDIGELAVNGTVNDLAMCGAVPKVLSAGFILEEGLPTQDLWRIVVSMRRAADVARVSIVTGDTKVVDRGKGDGVFINTAGIGVVRPGIEIAPSRAQAGDVLLVSGDIASHGIAIMAARQDLQFETAVESDTACVADIVGALLEALGEAVHVLRDPTRGGVASPLNEIAEAAGVGIVLDEAAIPVRETVRGACELLGFDPLYVANEGVFLAFVAPEKAQAALGIMRHFPHGSGARKIGTVVSDHPGRVVLKSAIGGSRVVHMLSGEQLPRIC